MIRFLFNSGALFGAAGFQLVFFMLSARYLGPEHFGEFSLLMAFATPAAEIAGLGAHTRMAQRIARYHRYYAPLFGTALVMVIATSIPITLVTAGFCDLLVVSHVSFATLLLLSASEIMFSKLIVLFEFVMLAHERQALANINRVTVAFARFAFAAIFFLGLKSTDFDEFAVGYFITTTLVCLVLGGLVVVLFGRPVYGYRGIRTLFGFSFVVSDFSRALSGTLDRIALSFVLNLEQLGIYSAGTRMIQVSSIPILTVGREVFPAFFRAGRNGIDSAVAFALSIAPRVLLISFVASAGGAVLSYMLPVLLGSKYAESAPIGAIISGAGIMIGLQFLAGDVLTCADRAPLRAQIQVAMMVVSFVLMMTGALVFGVFGAAITYVVLQGLTALAYAGGVALVSRRQSRNRRRSALGKAASPLEQGS